MKRTLKEIATRAANSSLTEMRTIIIVVLATVFIATTILSFFEINRLEMLILSGVILLAAIISHFGYYSTGSWLALLTALATISLFVFKNNGIRDTAVVGLITVLVAAGLLAGKTGTVAVGTIIILEIGIFSALEAQGVIVNKFSAENNFTDYLALSIAVALITILQWLIINRLNKTILNAEQELKERRSAEEKLQEAEARYRDLVERIPLVIYLAEPGGAGAWEYVSPQIASLTGYSPDEWLNNPNLWSSLIHPYDRERVLETENRASREGLMPQMEYRLKTRDGRYIWVYDESILAFGSDRHTLIQGFLLDITTRKLAEEQLKMRLAELQAMHGVSETLTQKTDLQKLIHETGEQIRFTFKAENVTIGIHDPNTDMIHFPYDFQDKTYRTDEPIRYRDGITTKIMEMKKPFIINEDWANTAHRMGAIITTGSPVKSSVFVPIMTDERVLGVIALDNAEREFAFSENDVRLLSTVAANLAVAVEKTRLQESLKHELEMREKLIRELEMKNEELERFTYTASHDLKSPLITIRGFLGYLEKDIRAGSTERLQADIKRISDATEKMHRLLTELLELSRVGRIVNEKQDVPFGTIVAEALRRVEGQRNQRHVPIRIGSDFPTIHVDKERVIEVVQNLVDNAVKFMGDQAEPQVEIGHAIKDGQDVFFVRDNGIGIKKEFHERIFGLFDKLSPDSEGTGVGLALVKRIIEVHGGRIWVESEEGRGSTFYFTLGSSG